MNLVNLLEDKNLKPKEKTEQLANSIANGLITVDDLIKQAALAKDPDKATCIESFEFVTKINPNIASEKLLGFVTENLASKAPRVKWESAKVIANIAHLFPKKLDKSIVQLIINTEDKGTVVRWSAAMALSEIIKLKTKHNKSLVSAIEAILKLEEKNSIKKIYLAAIKTLK